MSELSDKNAITGWRFHHTAVVVRDIARGIRTYRMLGYQVGEVVRDPLQNVDLTLCCRDDSTIELVAPVDETSPCVSYLNKSGPGPYHTCYACRNIEEALAHLKQQEVTYRILSSPKPAVLFGGARVAFLLLERVGLVELLEQEAEWNP